MRVFINGGTGMLGSHIALGLLNAGHEVTLFSRSAGDDPAWKGYPGVRLVSGDYRNEALLREVLPGHDACVSTVLTWGETAVSMLENDTLATVRFAQTAAECGVTRLVYTSSTAAVGDYRYNMHEEMISKPIDFYCATKRATEVFLLGLSYKSALRCNIVRPGVFFGGPAIPSGRFHRGTFFEQVAAKAKAGVPIEVTQGAGTQYMCVSDLAAVVIKILESNLNREIFFTLGKPWHSEEQIAREAVRLAGSRSQIIVKPNPNQEPPKTFTLEKIRDVFGFEFDPWEAIVGYLEFLLEEMA